MNILGKIEYTAKQLNEFLEHKGAPSSYSGFYIDYGKKYGVRGDIAVFQSCVETGFWKFGGDVKYTQNNFGGLGATGNGEPGAWFSTPGQGILAQIQHLAVYAGVYIPYSEIVYDRTEKLKQWGLAGTCKTWESLAGQWAADRNYWKKIQAVMKEFEEFIGTTGEDTMSKTYWAKRFPSGNIYLMEEPGSIARERFETNNETKKLLEAYESLLKKEAKTTVIGSGLEPEIEKEDDQKPEPKPVGTMPKIDITQYDSPNFSNRAGTITHIVLHNTAGSFDGAVSWLCNSRARASAHLIISRTGKTACIVPFSKAAWHAGNSRINNCSIGIEIEDMSTDQGMPSAQDEKVVEWCKWMMRKYGIKAENIGIHRWYSSTDCPILIWDTDAKFLAWRKKHFGV